MILFRDTQANLINFACKSNHTMERINNRFLLITELFLLMLLSSLSVQCSSSGKAVQVSLDEMIYSPEGTDFSVWAPTAEAVTLSLYDEGDGDSPAVRTIPMKPEREGRWNARVEGNLKGKFYTFKIRTPEKEYLENPGIFAKAVGVNGRRGAVVDLSQTNPEGWEKDSRPAFGRSSAASDVILYELQHRDFSVGEGSGIAGKGRFLALTEHGTTNSMGLKTGLDHLVELGITHVHLMPSYDFGSVDETTLSRGDYNWGYDPVNYNVPDGSFSTDPFDPLCRIREFKQMVLALHESGIRVVMDVVYNHTYDVEHSNFENTAPGYFYRTNPDGTLSNGSGCGNETASDREMMRRFMIESVKYWATEYHIDGFRFDLMGIHDIETMNRIREELDRIDPSIIVYGEGWAAGTCQLEAEKQAIKAGILRMSGIAAFGDELRDAVRGPFSDDTVGAFLTGVEGNEESIRFGLAGAIDHPQVNMASVNYSKEPWALQPTQMISYVSCHDDMCLADRLRNTLRIDGKPADEKTLARVVGLGESIALLSQGIPFIYCGEEILRDKKMVHNSFKSPDEVNAINWESKSANESLYNYLKGIISLRKAHPAFHMGDADLVREHMEFLPVDESGLVSFLLKNHAAGDSWKDIVVAFNANPAACGIEIPDGDWIVVCRDGIVDEDGISTVSGTIARVPAFSTLILYR